MGYSETHIGSYDAAPNAEIAARAAGGIVASAELRLLDQEMTQHLAELTEFVNWNGSPIIVADYIPHDAGPWLDGGDGISDGRYIGLPDNPNLNSGTAIREPVLV